MVLKDGMKFSSKDADDVAAVLLVSWVAIVELEFESANPPAIWLTLSIITGQCGVEGIGRLDIPCQ